MTGSPAWLPIVWGRTRTGDSWWRARPTGPRLGEWVTDLVSAVFAGGADLAAPRFLLARAHGHWVTGVACSAADLDASMSIDAHGRELFTFVGWLAPVDGGAVELPALVDWAAHRTAWAGATYTEWCLPDWDKHWSDAAIAQQSVPQGAPWPIGTRPPDAVPEPLITDASRAVLHPEADAARLWASGTASITSFILVTGWSAIDALDPDRLTHATVRGLTEPRPIVRKGLSSLIEPEPEPSDEPDDASLAGLTRESIPAGGSRRGWRERLPEVVSPARWDQLQADMRAMRDELDRCRQEVAELRARVEEMSARDGSPAEGADGTR